MYHYKLTTYLDALNSRLLLHVVLKNDLFQNYLIFEYFNTNK